jgi:excisionase family DNA binding protein
MPAIGAGMTDTSDAVSETAKPASIRRPNPSASPRTGPAGPPVVGRLCLSLNEVASALGVSYATVWRLVQRGQLRRVKGLRHVYVAKSELDRFIAA